MTNQSHFAPTNEQGLLNPPTKKGPFRSVGLVHPFAHLDFFTKFLMVCSSFWADFATWSEPTVTTCRVCCSRPPRPTPPPPDIAKLDPFWVYQKGAWRCRAEGGWVWVGGSNKLYKSSRLALNAFSHEGPTPLSTKPAWLSRRRRACPTCKASSP